MERRDIQRILNKNLCETWLLSRPHRQKAIWQVNWQTYKKVSWNRHMGIKNLDWFKLGRSPVQDYLLGHVQTASGVAAIFALLSESAPQRCDFTTDVKLVQTTTISFSFKLMWSSFESSISRLQLSSFQLKSSQFLSLKAARWIRSRSTLAVVSTGCAPWLHLLGCDIQMTRSQLCCTAVCYEEHCLYSPRTYI